MARKRKAKPVAPTTFPLSLGWIVSNAFGPALFLPLLALVMLIVLGPETSVPDIAAVAAIILGAIVAVILGINLPSVLRTLLSDRSIELREHELYVPVVQLFQRRPWTIALGEIELVSSRRRSGGSTKIVLQVRGGRNHSFPAVVVQDYHALLGAIQRRIGRGADVLLPP
jgi:hypothetical protein